jgi:8-oxo-dGTP pyrophosphatase MutT (NUDIX family)/chemotaxis protein histidine kinase CheA
MTIREEMQKWLDSQKLKAERDAWMRSNTRTDSDSEGRWVTINNTHVLIGKDGRIKSGAEGKFNGQTEAQMSKGEEAKGGGKDAPTEPVTVQKAGPDTGNKKIPAPPGKEEGKSGAQEEPPIADDLGDLNKQLTEAQSDLAVKRKELQKAGEGGKAKTTAQVSAVVEGNKAVAAALAKVDRIKTRLKTAAQVSEAMPTANPQNEINKQKQEAQESGKQEQDFQTQQEKDKREHELKKEEMKSAAGKESAPGPTTTTEKTTEKVAANGGKTVTKEAKTETAPAPAEKKSAEKPAEKPAEKKEEPAAEDKDRPKRWDGTPNPPGALETDPPEEREAYLKKELAETDAEYKKLKAASPVDWKAIHKTSDYEQSLKVSLKRHQDKQAEDAAVAKDPSTITAAEKSAVKVYSSASYESINKQLRSGKEEAGGMYNHEIGVLDAALNKKTLPTGTKLKRYIDAAGIKQLFGGEPKVGSVGTDKAFMSTSDSKTWEKNEHQLVMETPAGQKGLKLGNLSKYEEEGEVLLPRGTSLKVTSIGTSKGKKLIKCEIVQNGDTKADSVPGTARDAQEQCTRLTPMEYVQAMMARCHGAGLSATRIMMAKKAFLETHGETPQTIEEYSAGIGQRFLLALLNEFGIPSIEETVDWFNRTEARADAGVVQLAVPVGEKIAAGVLFITDSGYILLGQRAEPGEYQGHWGIFGGHAEPGEPLELTAMREVLEETGHEIEQSQIEGEAPPLQLIAETELDGTKFSYFINVCKPFEVRLNDEHTTYGWFAMGAMPEPLIPGLQEVIDSDLVKGLRLRKMNETDVARAMAWGALPSPMKFANVSMYKMRITGTGAAFRSGQPEIKNADGKVTQVALKDEHCFRPPEHYLNEDFLERCQGLNLIFEHPKKRILNSKEFNDRKVGNIVQPYIWGDEVWGIGKVYDQDTIDILDHEVMSTSPAVQFGDNDGNTIIPLSDGSQMLIEGKARLLDHLAICEQGVWDKGGPPTGIISESAK